MSQYHGTKFVWKARIQTSNLVPSDGMCVSTLNLAARKGDPGLATSVIRILSVRRSALSPFHYEALLAAYTQAQDVKMACRVLTIMSKAGHEPNSYTTRPVFLYLTQDHTLSNRAWNVLKSLHEDGHVVPVAAVNVVIEAKINLGYFDKAVEFYKELHTICEGGPNGETFNILLQGTQRQGNKSMAMFLASEMRALGIKADRLTYDRFILVCLKEDDYEDAFRYLEEMKSVGADKEENGQKGWWMRGGTGVLMVQRCVKARDPRAWDVLNELENRALTSDHKLRKWAEENWEGPARDPDQTNNPLVTWATV